MDWFNHTTTTNTKPNTDNISLANAFQAFVNTKLSQQQQTQTQLPPQQQRIVYQQQQQQQPTLQYQQYPAYPPYLYQPQQTNQYQNNNNNNNNNNDMLLNKIGNIMDEKMKEMKKEMNILRDDVNILNRNGNRNGNEIGFDGDDEYDDDDDDVMMTKILKNKKKEKKKKQSIKTTKHFKDKVLWTAINKQTASSIKLAKNMDSKTDIILSVLKYWKKKNFLLNHGHNGFKLIAELKQDELDIDNIFIIKLKNKFGKFEFEESELDDDDDDDSDTDTDSNFFKVTPKPTKQLSIYLNCMNTHFGIHTFSASILSAVRSLCSYATNKLCVLLKKQEKKYMSKKKDTLGDCRFYPQ